MFSDNQDEKSATVRSAEGSIATVQYEDGQLLTPQGSAQQ